MGQNGRNIFTNSTSTTEFQLIGQELSFGSGFGKHDLNIVLPFYLVKEKIMTSLSELLLSGGTFPSYGIVNVFSEDKGISDEIIRCVKDLGKELSIRFDSNITIAKGISTSFIVTLFSTVEKQNLRFNRAQEGQWIYFITLKNNYISLNNDRFFDLEFIQELSESQGIAESYLLKDESIMDGLNKMLQDTNCFYVERENHLNILKTYKPGTGIIFISPYRLLKSSNKNIEIIEVGSIFNKNI